MTAAKHVSDGTHKDVPLYLSLTGPCPYLQGRVEQTIFTRTETPTAALATTLVQMGFRRSQDIFYRPQCPGCSACVPIRVDVQSFTPSKTQRRTLKKNADLVVVTSHPQPTAELFDLFHAYTSARHETGGMGSMDYAAFRTFMEQGATQARLMTARDADGKLAGAVLYDAVNDGASAIYSWFDPQATGRSLGVFLILSLLEKVRAQGKAYLYLGYWIGQSAKMSYKTAYRPYELFLDNQWKRP